MAAWLSRHRFGPIGVDVGSRSVKLLQLDAQRQRVMEVARWDVAGTRPDDPAAQDAQLVEAIRRAREGRGFRGREAVLCLGGGRLFVQNIRVPQANGAELDRVVCAEAANRVPFAKEETEVRFVEAADVRQGDGVRREVIVMACHRPVLQRLLAVAEGAGLRPVAVDAEPNALLRCYTRQFRRDEDLQQRAMFVTIGASSTVVVIARGNLAMFVKYLDIGGQQFDQAVAQHLKMRPDDAVALRRHNGDRRADQRDPEVTRSIAEATRPVLDRLANELSMCVRYYSVTFRGQPLSRVVVGGGEANESLVENLFARLGIPCELGDPLRSYERSGSWGRVGQWDVAAGLALREIN